MEDRRITCIMCPKGCPITVGFNDDASIAKISGNSCRRGYEYAYSEVHHPVRTLTTTVRTAGGRMAAVKTSAPIPKELIFDAMAQINALCPADDIAFGTVVIQGICGTDADVVVTSD